MEKQKILIVDEQPENIQFLQEILQEKYTVLVAFTEQEALSNVQTQPVPDLVLLDISMSEAEGIALCKKIKSHPLAAHVPIVFITSMFDSGSEELGLNAGAIDYLSKPIKPALVLARIKNHLELKSYRDDLERRVEQETQKRLEQQSVLMQQSKMASMGEMIGAITHQWRQPINVLNLLFGKLDLLQENGMLDEAAVKDIVKHGEEMVQSMNQTIDDFRSFFKPNKLMQQFQPCEYLLKVKEMFKDAFEKQRIVIIVHEHEHFTTTGTPNEFMQAILIIFNNARDILLENEIKEAKIECFIAHDTAKGVIRVRDNGGGIPEALLPEKIFEPYVSTKAEKGTGVGLQIAKTIIEEKMHGKLLAHNVKSGAEFVIELPLTLV